MGGIIVGPVGAPAHQDFVRVIKRHNGIVATEYISAVRFVPLTSREAQLRW
jgi:protein-L-isoaspartate O-methyltransferase